MLLSFYVLQSALVGIKPSDTCVCGQPHSNKRCYDCGEFGHYSSRCPKTLGRHTDLAERQGQEHSSRHSARKVYRSTRFVTLCQLGLP